MVMDIVWRQAGSVGGMPDMTTTLLPANGRHANSPCDVGGAIKPSPGFIRF
jgi:hypothetical protein